MIHILFLILKIIGIILLAILGILLVTLAIVLFVPIHYQIEAETSDGMENLSVHGKAHWILHLVYAYFVYEEKKTDWQVRIGWKQLNHKKEKTVKQVPKKENFKEESEREQKKKAKEEAKQASEQSEQNQTEKKNWFTKIKCTILEFCDKIKKLSETKDKWLEFLTDETHQAAFQRLKKEILIFARHIRPRRIKGYVRFGLDDPYKTGQVLAVLSMLYPFYGDHVQIYPEFEQKILEGNLHMRGHMSVIRFLIIVLNLYFDKNIKETYKNYKLLKS